MSSANGENVPTHKAKCGHAEIILQVGSRKSRSGCLVLCSAFGNGGGSGATRPHDHDTGPRHAWARGGAGALAQKPGEVCGEGISVDELLELTDLGRIDGYYASFEWSDGGFIHAHIAFWMVGSPRIDRVVVPRDQADGSVHLDGPLDQEIVVTEEKAASLLGCLCD